MKNIQFIQNLIENVRWTDSLYQSHITYYGELLPHILMEEISEVFLAICDELFVSKSNSQENLTKLNKFLTIIENGMNSDSEEVTNLIILSFLENINPEVTSFISIKGLMGASLKAELEKLMRHQYGGQAAE
jgi:hypothetical protein